MAGIPTCVLNHIQVVLRMYDTSVDLSHGSDHIIRVINNVKQHYDKFDFQGKYGIPIHVAMLTAAYHDIGLIVHPMYHDAISLLTDPIARRDIHHITGSAIFAMEMSKLQSYLWITPAQISVGVQAILNHRASGRQYSEFDKFIRCCDGLETHDVLMLRAMLWTDAHHQDASDDEKYRINVTHLHEKYLTTMQYANTLPIPEFDELYAVEVRGLAGALGSIHNHDEYVKYVNMFPNTRSNRIRIMRAEQMKQRSFMHLHSGKSLEYPCTHTFKTDWIDRSTTYDDVTGDTINVHPITAQPQGEPNA